MIIYAYCRTSYYTPSLEEQTKLILEKYPNAIIVEELYTGYKLDRPRFQELLSQVRAGDLVVATTLDRLVRNLDEGVRYLKELRERNISVDILNMGLVDDRTITMLELMIDFNRVSHRELSMEGMELQQLKDPKCKTGRKPYVPGEKFIKEYGMVKLGYEKQYEMARHLHLSQTTIRKVLREHPEFDTYEYYLEDENE